MTPKAGPLQKKRNNWRGRHSRLPALAVAMFFLCPVHILASEPPKLVRVTFLDAAGQSLTVDGMVVVEAADGGILLMGRDGRLWSVTPSKRTGFERLSQPFTRLNSRELAKSLSEELGPSFEIVQTRHYVIATSTGPHYAQWCGELFERLLDAFLAHWKAQGLELNEPAWPLPAVIFATRQEFKAHASSDAGRFGEDSQGYYSSRTNRIVLYDLAAGSGKKKATSAAEVKRRTADAAFNVATIVHEATHQVAYNSGMHTRFADNPLWLTEGLAMYFETPDLEGEHGWKTIGQMNRLRYDRFIEFTRRRRKRDSLTTLVTQQDRPNSQRAASQRDRFVDPKKAADAYAESWALTYFLNAKHPQEYVAYLKRVASKPPLIWDERDVRLSDFQAAFGSDMKSLDSEFLRFMKSLPKR